MGTETTGDKENAAIAAVLLKRKEALGVSFEALAESTGFGLRTVKRYLHDERLLRVRDVRILANALDLSIVEVLNQAEIS